MVGNPQVTDPIKFTPQTGTLEKLTYALDYVGAFKGFGVNAAMATVVAQDAISGQNMGAAMEVNGAGRIFAWGDDQVIAANEWAPPPSATPANTQQDQYNICWVMPTDTQPGFFHSAATLYQTKQFWYDVINWVAPPNECGFVIRDPYVVVY